MALRSRMRHRARTTDRILRASVAAASLALLFAVPAAPLDPETNLSQYLVSFWQESAGLPQKFVNSLYQSRDGYLWVGTKGGLARFDGVSFEVYDDLKPDQLREAEVWAVTESVDGALWIGTYGGGLTRFFEGRFETIARDEGLPSNMVLDLVPLADGRLWIATASGLVLRETDGKLRSFGVAEGLPSASILSLLMDSDETLWVGTEGGLASVRDGRITSHAALQRQVLGRPVSAIVRGTDGGLWLALSVGGGQGYGLARYEGGQITHFTTRDGLPSDSVTSLAFDSHGALWIGTLGGLSRYRSGRFESYSAQTTAVSRRGTMETVTLRNVEAVLADREGNLWVGTQADGLARLRDTQFVSLTPGLSADFNSVFEDREGGMWIGATEGIRHLSQGREVRYALPGDLSAQSFAQDPEGVVWIGTQRGIFVAKAGAVSRLALGEVDSLSISVLFTDAKGRIWIGARQAGLFRFDGRALRRYGPEDGVLGTQVRTIAESPYGEIWVGTRNGGVTVIRDDGVKSVGPAQGLASETAQSIWLDRDGDAWVATRKGLCRIRNGRVTTITAKSGLPSNYFYQIIEDDEGHLWLTFARGIVRVARSELNHVADGGSGLLELAAFGTDNGMCSTAMTVAVQPTAWKRTNGELWFATARCVSVIHPRVLARRSAAPEAKVETVSVGAQKEAARSGLRFAPGNGNVEIRYTGLSLVSSDRMTFRYRMDTVHEGWIDAGTRRVAYFTGLRPGDHDFEVVACSGEGICSETGAKLSFHLQPRFTQTWWWRTILGLLAFAVVFAAYRWRVRALQAYQRELARRIDERTRDLQQEVEEHQRTEARLGEQMGERERAETEAREYAHKLAASNVGLLESHEAIERENAERRRAEEEAGRERDLLHALMDNTPDQIYFKDASLRYTRVNEAHARALGLPDPSAAVGRTDADFFSEEFVKSTAADERLLLTQRTPLVNKVDHDPRSRRWFMATKAPLGDARGESQGLVGISKDVTQGRQAEERLEQDLHELLHTVSRIAQGDLRVRARSGDDVIGRIAASVNEMQAAFAGILGEVHQVASAVVSTASRVLTSANEIAQAAQYGSEEASSTTASVERMASAMTKVAGSAEQSATTAKRALEHVTAGAESVGATYVGMTRIDLAVSETATKMRLLEARSREIVEITELIEEIGSQSNLLSLNAAIEAAHAGEAGRGFSVVAEEIRRLAERSKAATSNVAAIVSGIVDETRTVLQAMENGMAEVRNGRELSERAQKSLKDIELLVGEAATLSGGIASASQQQTKATEAVAEAMQAIASITHQSAAGATQATRAVQDLVALSEKLSRALSRFTIEGGPPS